MIGSKFRLCHSVPDFSNMPPGSVPSLWKQVNVIPIFKKGDKSVMNNYRSISLISVIEESADKNLLCQLRSTT